MLRAAQMIVLEGQAYERTDAMYENEDKNYDQTEAGKEIDDVQAEEVVGGLPYRVPNDPIKIERWREKLRKQGVEDA